MFIGKVAYVTDAAAAVVALVAAVVPVLYVLAVVVAAVWYVRDNKNWSNRIKG